MSKRQKIVSFLVVPVAIVLVIVLGAFRSMSQKDTEHARFYNTGKTINDFLKSYCTHLEEAQAAGDPSPLGGLLAAGYSSPGRGSWVWGEPRQEGDITIRDLVKSGDADFGRKEHLAEAGTYLAGLQRIDQTICKIDMIEQIEPERDVTLTMKLILDGVEAEGAIFQDRMFYRWRLLNEPAAEEPYAWRIERDELVEGIRVSGDAQGFVAVDAAALGVDFVHRRDPKLHMKKYRDELQFGVIQHASGGISAADYNGDGRDDLFFLGGVECRLYRNEGTSGEDGLPRFSDVTQEAGLGGLDQVHTALFADFDNDGDRDLFVGRYLAPSLYFENQGEGTFTDATEAAGLNLVAPVTAATLLDYDRDGFLDVYLAVNGNAFEAFPRLPFFAQNGQPNRLLRNDGGKRFVDVTEESGTGDVGWSLAVAAGDVDGDGWSDLVVANDFGRKNLYMNNGGGADGVVTFTESARSAAILDFSGGMGVALGDFDDDGDLDVYMSNINSNQRWFGEDMTVIQYTRNVLRSKWFLADFGEFKKLYDLIGNDWMDLGTQIGEGNSLFKNRGGGVDGRVTFEELKDSHTSRAGWGWSVAFLDYDNDTDLDLYAANGWISNTPGTDL